MPPHLCSMEYESLQGGQSQDSGKSGLGEPWNGTMSHANYESNI